MGIAERLFLPPSTDSSKPNTLQRLDAVFDTLHRHSQIDYLILGKTDDLQFLLYPYGAGTLGYSELISLGRYVGRLLDQNFPVEQVSSIPGENTPESFRFPTFSVDGEQGLSSLLGIIYPTQYYAEQVRETDVLQFESKRWTSLENRPSLLAEIEAKKRVFPKFEIPHERLQEVLARR